jgi:hypothetical protein
MTRALIDDGWTDTVYTDHDGWRMVPHGHRWQVICTCGLMSKRMPSKAVARQAGIKHEAHCDGSTWKGPTSTL